MNTLVAHHNHCTNQERSIELTSSEERS